MAQTETEPSDRTDYEPVVQQAIESSRLTVDDAHDIITIVDDYISDDIEDGVTPSSVRAAILVAFTDPMAECRDNGEPRGKTRDGAALYGDMLSNRDVLSSSGLFDKYDERRREILLERARESVYAAFDASAAEFIADYPYIVLDRW